MAGTTTRSLGMPRSKDLAEYESELNRFVPRYPQVIVCLHDLLVFENPHYLSPDEYRSAKS